jgi:hypothetical protein
MTTLCFCCWVLSGQVLYARRGLIRGAEIEAIVHLGEGLLQEGAQPAARMAARCSPGSFQTNDWGASFVSLLCLYSNASSVLQVQMKAGATITWPAWGG